MQTAIHKSCDLIMSAVIFSLSQCHCRVGIQPYHIMIMNSMYLSPLFQSVALMATYGLACCLLTSSGIFHHDTHLATLDPPPLTEPSGKETLPKMVACRLLNTASFRSGSLTTTLRSLENCNHWFSFMPPGSSWRVHCIQSLLLCDDVPQLCGPYFWPHHVGPSHLDFIKTHGWLYSWSSLTYNRESTVPSYFRMTKRTEGVAANPVY